MDALLKPDIGLTFWTVVNFLILAFILAKFAWKPMVSALDKREKQIASDIENAKKANADAQKIKDDLKGELDKLAKESSVKIKEAAEFGEREKQRILQAAKEQAQTLINQARVQIGTETNKAVEALRNEVVNITMQAVKKVIGKEVDEKTNAQMVEDLLKDIKK
jgi:F-type H+-transporting ATPase subunit b